MAGVNLTNAYAQLGNRDQALQLLDTMREVIGNDKVLNYEYSFAFPSRSFSYLYLSLSIS